MIRAVIFDLEGVLVNTEEYQYRAWQHLAHEQGLPADASMIHNLTGRGRMESIRMLLGRANRKYSDAEIMALSMRKGDLFIEYTEQMGEKDLLPGVLENLEQLRKAGIRTAAASSSRNGRYILYRAGLRNSLDAIVDGTDVVNPKPDPEVYRKAAGALKAAFRECLVVEDSELGIEAASSLGMQVLSVGEAMNSEHARYHAGDLAGVSLAELIGRINREQTDDPDEKAEGDYVPRGC